VSHTCNAEVSRACDQQTSTTTNVVDVDWTVTVINNLRTAYFSASSPSLIQSTTEDGYKFSAVRRLRQRLLDQSKNTIFTHPTCIWHHCGYIWISKWSFTS